VQEHFNYDRCLVIWGTMADKDLAELAEIIGTFADRVILTRPQNERSADPHNLFKLVEKYNKVIEIIDEIPYALLTAQKQSGPADLILVTGSVFTVAEAKQALEFEGIH
jgi:dihydrofolate synthase/folylpolyglutamate synthase